MGVLYVHIQNNGSVHKGLLAVWKRFRKAQNFFWVTQPTFREEQQEQQQDKLWKVD
jgi:hypothetical protein